MEIALTPADAKKECPNEFNDVVAQMAKKKLQLNSLSFSYSFCVRIDNDSPDMTSEDAYINSLWAKYGVCLQATNGTGNKTKRSSSQVIKNIPPTFTKIFKDRYAELIAKESMLKIRQNNLDGILKKVGKKGSCVDTRPIRPAVMNGLEFFNSIRKEMFAVQPVFPTLEDFIKAEPLVYQQYLLMADGTKLIEYSPQRLDLTDPWGFKIWKAKCAYKPTKRKGDEFIRILFHDGDNFYQCALYDELLNATDHNIKHWIQASGSDKAVNAQDGTDFLGWHKAVYHKFTASEMAIFLQGRVFELHLDYLLD